MKRGGHFVFAFVMMLASAVWAIQMGAIGEPGKGILLLLAAAVFLLIAWEIDARPERGDPPNVWAVKIGDSLLFGPFLDKTIADDFRDRYSQVANDVTLVEVNPPDLVL